MCFDPIRYPHKIFHPIRTDQSKRPRLIHAPKWGTTDKGRRSRVALLQNIGGGCVYVRQRGNYGTQTTGAHKRRKKHEERRKRWEIGKHLERCTTRAMPARTVSVAGEPATKHNPGSAGAEFTIIAGGKVLFQIGPCECPLYKGSGDIGAYRATSAPQRNLQPRASDTSLSTSPAPPKISCLQRKRTPTSTDQQRGPGTPSRDEKGGRATSVRTVARG